MTVRSRTQVSDPVGSFVRRPGDGGSSQQPRSQTFLAPGTWTWPGNVTHVQVLVVGGGGGGAALHLPPTATNGVISGSGGGGGVRLEYEVPVSAPVPVTVGAGGAGGPATSPNARHGGKGGDSSFGPIAVGGGGGGMSGQPTSAPTAATYVPAPPNGGSPGTFYNPYSASNLVGGTYGCYTIRGVQYAGGAGSETGFGRLGFGAGGLSQTNTPAPVVPLFVGQTGAYYWGVSSAAGGSAIANSGAGGNGWDMASLPISVPGGSGGSGIVIVSWWE